MSMIGDRLKEEILRIGGVTVASKVVDTATNTIYNWVAKGNIPANKLVLLAGAGVDMHYILMGDRTQNIDGYPALKPSNPPSIAEEKPMHPRTRALISLYEELDENTKNEVFGIVAEFNGLRKWKEKAPS